jgi:lipopolysaccharide/colanic/teichoic acid biosynthesis glycosyltransferase
MPVGFDGRTLCLTNMLDSKNCPGMFWPPGGSAMDVGASQQAVALPAAAIDGGIEPVVVPHITAHRPAHGRFGAILKRSEDLILSCTILVMFSWLLFLIAVAIKLNSAGPVFFIQDRRGRHGETFRCLKFRSMYDKDSDHVCRVQTRQHDPRVTTVGRWLRRHSLDELPQLFNVIVGHMSLVGPRPHALGTNIDGRLLHEIADEYLSRYRVKPGITGWAQVNGWRGILDTEEKVRQRLRHDLYYIENWSLLFDLRILFRTLTCLFDNERAF